MRQVWVFASEEVSEQTRLEVMRGLEIGLVLESANDIVGHHRDSVAEGDPHCRSLRLRRTPANGSSPLKSEYSRAIPRS